MLIIKLIIAYLLDCIFGDPQNFPHPVRFIGRLINALEKIKIPFNAKIRGFFILLLVCAITYWVTLAIASIHVIFEIILLYTVFATKSLATEGSIIFNLLKKGELEKARNALRFIVSRDTETLNQNEVIRATVETISENINDGIIAPLFFLLLGGLPLAMVFKAVSTLDSMIGYKNEKYHDLGYFSAKTDDILNYIPARLTGFVIIPLAVIVIGKNPLRSLQAVIKFRHNHESPNSAHGEAAVAGALGIRLGGLTIYDGKIEQKPYIGWNKKELHFYDIQNTVHISWISSLIAFCIVIGILMVVT